LLFTVDNRDVTYIGCLPSMCLHTKNFWETLMQLPTSLWYDIPSPRTVAFHHRLNRKRLSQSPPFAHCTYAWQTNRAAELPGRTTKRQNKACSMVLKQQLLRVIFKFKSPLVETLSQWKFVPCDNLLPYCICIMAWLHLGSNGPRHWQIARVIWYPIILRN